MSDPRPLSPHLQIYRWQLTSVMSLLGAESDGPESYAGFQQFMGSWFGLLLLFGWSVALFYHLCNGIRHLWWDTGRGLELKSVYRGGWTVLAATAALTVLAWIAGLSRGRRRALRDTRAPAAPH